MKKICITTSSYPKFRGDTAGIFVHELARHLVQLGHEVWVLCPQVLNLPSDEVIDGVNVVRFRYALRKTSQNLIGVEPGISNTRSMFKLLKVPVYCICQIIALIKLIREYEVDVVNSHWLIPQGVTTAVVTRILGKHHVPTFHSTDVYLAGKLPFKRHICNFVQNSTSGMFIVSRFVRKRYEKIIEHSSNATVLPMGVDTDVFCRTQSFSCGEERDLPKRILFVGRLHHIKGVEFLVRALPFLQSSIVLDIVGDGEERDNLRLLTQELGVAENVNFIGRIDNADLPHYYQQSDVIVVPSLLLPSGETEGMPVVILEAMACGKPVVASDVGGISDVVNDGYNGFLANAGDCKSLADSIIKVFERLAELSENAYETSLRYSWAAITCEYSDYFEDKCN